MNLEQQLEALADTAIAKTFEFFQPNNQEEINALAEDLLWGQESELGYAIGQLLTEWLAKRIESKLS